MHPWYKDVRLFTEKVIYDETYERKDLHKHSGNRLNSAKTYMHCFFSLWSGCISLSTTWQSCIENELLISHHCMAAVYKQETAVHENSMPYSQKIWWELNLADWPQPAWTKILVDFNLADDQSLT